MRRLLVACALVALASPALAEEEPYRTPRAGESHKERVLGFELEAPERDRSQIVALLGAAALHAPRIAANRTDLLAAFFYRGYWETRFARVAASAFANEAELAQRFSAFEVVARGSSYTLPGGRVDPIDDDEAKLDRVKYGRVLGELGVGHRTRTGPAVDNELRLDLFYEAAWVYVRRASDTGSGVRLPPDTLEHGVHLRATYDGLARNVLELPHEGVSASAELELLRRDRWGTTRFTTFTYDRDDARDFLRATAHVAAATGLPFLSERHRFVLSLHGGYAPPRNLDRFSSFRVGSGPLGAESYALARVRVPGLLLEQLRLRDYAVGMVEYRLETLFFLYLHLRWTTAFANRLALRDDGTARYVRQAGHALSTGISSGFLLQSSLYLEYAFSTAQLRGRDGHSVLFVLTKAF